MSHLNREVKLAMIYAKLELSKEIRLESNVRESAAYAVKTSLGRRNRAEEEKDPDRATRRPNFQ